MKKRFFAVAFVVVLAAGVTIMRAAKPAGKTAPGASLVETPLVLPAEATAKRLLNSTPRHREWDSVTLGSSKIWAFVVYPERSDKAPVVIVTAKNQGQSDWIRAVSDQVAADGFIAVAPDVLSGLGPKGGDTESFAGPAAVAQAIERMGQEDISRRIEAVREYAIALPAADGKSASLDFDPRAARITAAVKEPAEGQGSATFNLNDREWTQALDFLTVQTNNHPILGANTMAEEHAGHDHMAMMMAMAQASGGGPTQAQITASLAQKSPDLPPNYYTAQSAVAHSKLKKQWVDIDIGEDVKLHMRIEYPPGDGKAGIVIAMQHGTGLDNWMLGVVDQLASQGFIAVAPDIWSGTLPGGANRDYLSTFPDDAMKAGAKINGDETMKRYKAAREYALKLPRSNGKTGSLGFCAGGNNSFLFAAEVPELNAAVVFYGTAPSEALMAKINAPVLGLYGENDARVTSTVEPTIANMKRLGKSYEPHIYPKTTHSFVMFQDAGGNPAAIRDAWPRAIAFLKQHMS